MEILKLNRKNYQKIFQRTRKALEKGKIVVCPTDTVYGLVGQMTNSEVVKKIFKIKKRPTKKALPIFVKDIKMAKKLAYFNKKQEGFLRKVWPGRVTIILKGKKKKTIGLRIPNYKLILDLIEILNSPLIGTSANISGQPASTKIKEVIKQFKNKKDQPDLILHGGNLKAAQPSTVIDLTGRKPKILRKGDFSKRQLLKFLN